MTTGTERLTCSPRHSRQHPQISCKQKPNSSPVRESNSRPLDLQSLILTTRPTRQLTYLYTMLKFVNSWNKSGGSIIVVHWILRKPAFITFLLLWKRNPLKSLKSLCLLFWWCEWVIYYSGTSFWTAVVTIRWLVCWIITITISLLDPLLDICSSH